MLDFKKIENICAIVLIVAFFLPWVSLGGMFSFAGYQLPNAAEGINAMAAAWSESGEADTNYGVYLVYLVPLLAVGVLATDYLKSDEKVAHYVAIAAGVLPVLGFLYMVIDNGMQGMAIGIYLTVVAAIVMLLATFGVIKRPE
tara:strand:- start:1130 stop:1558 length:429 start_codon:yes stop_codon:yes gene_type:complete